MAKTKAVKINGQKFKDGDLVTLVIHAKVRVIERADWQGKVRAADVSFVNTSKAEDADTVEAWPEVDFVDSNPKAKDNEYRAPGVTVVKH